MITTLPLLLAWLLVAQSPAGGDRRLVAELVTRPGSAKRRVRQR